VRAAQHVLAPPWLRHASDGTRVGCTAQAGCAAGSKHGLHARALCHRRPGRAVASCGLCSACSSRCARSMQTAARTWTARRAPLVRRAPSASVVWGVRRLRRAGGTACARPAAIAMRRRRYIHLETAGLEVGRRGHFTSAALVHHKCGAGNISACADPQASGLRAVEGRRLRTAEGSTRRHLDCGPSRVGPCGRGSTLAVHSPCCDRPGIPPHPASLISPAPIHMHAQATPLFPSPPPLTVGPDGPNGGKLEWKSRIARGSVRMGQRRNGKGTEGGIHLGVAG
jgi:hypothetical protein